MAVYYQRIVDAFSAVVTLLPVVGPTLREQHDSLNSARAITIMQNAHVLLPDALVVLAIVIASRLGDFCSEAMNRRLTYLIALLSSIAACMGFAIVSFDSHRYYFFSRMIVVDPFASVMKATVSLGFAVSLVYSRRYLEDRDMFRDHVFLLGMFSLLGQLIMISGNHFLMLYLGLELMSLSLYAMVALRRDVAQSSEAAMKYYVLGALATGFLLYGISMLYGATGSLELNEVLKVVGSSRANDPLLLFGVIFIVAGVAFKMGAVPFHIWVPDVYQGAPTAMTLFVGGGPKVAAFAWGMRFLVMGLLPLAAGWQAMLVIKESDIKQKVPPRMAFSFTSKDWHRPNIEINDLRQSRLPPPVARGPLASIGSYISRIREHAPVSARNGQASALSSLFNSALH
jgi:hypothetical protein